ncbi:MAG: hypothetical protein GY750_17620 [Lentisphaerae bacterium]|nr:hypothetical protein [Lentisphaerota bacterium]MCP4103218.1 hypothetical protein [Lentisphaerota bacterium]
MDEWTIIYIGSGTTEDAMGSDIWATLQKFMEKINTLKPQKINIAIGYHGINKYTTNNGYYLYSTSKSKLNIKQKYTPPFNWDLCDYKSITTFLKYVINTCGFTSKKYMVIFSSHGAGLTLERRNGAAFCRGPRKRGVTVREMRKMMSDVSQLIQKPVDVVLMDACLMQTISIPMALGSSAKYYVASQPIISIGQALNYESFADLIHKIPEVTPKDLATNLTTKLYDTRSAMSLSAVDVQKTCSYETKNTINSFARLLMMYPAKKIHTLLRCMGYLNQHGKYMRDIVALMEISKRLATTKRKLIDEWILQIKSCRVEPFVNYTYQNSCNPKYNISEHLDVHPTFIPRNSKLIQERKTYNAGYARRLHNYKKKLKQYQEKKLKYEQKHTEEPYPKSAPVKPKKKKIPKPKYRTNPSEYYGGGYNGMSIYMTDIRYEQTFFKEIGLEDWGELLWYLFTSSDVYSLFNIKKPSRPDDSLSLGFHEIKYKTPTARLLATNPNYSYDDYMRCRQEYDDF